MGRGAVGCVWGVGGGDGGVDKPIRERRVLSLGKCKFVTDRRRSAALLSHGVGLKGVRHTTPMGA